MLVRVDDSVVSPDEGMTIHGFQMADAMAVYSLTVRSVSRVGDMREFAVGNGYRSNRQSLHT
ncbi:hypothetical protein C487_13809 [Natrinema pallidum DSM 3751]|uniref:Uncharacterized protein n=1 Tax=Natrinema pallidum DSM 3751 TaxID=1227495 RepID=L9YP87_9EURY|nr:hypothetical protein C487_13809 [Natrinema pallidum DSM 3751]